MPAIPLGCRGVHATMGRRKPPMKAPDPRVYARSADQALEALFAQAVASMGSASVSVTSAIDGAIATQFARQIIAGDAASLATAIDSAPSAAIARHLWRRLIEAWTIASQPPADAELATTLFALPVVIVVGAQAAQSATPADLGAVLPDPNRVAAILRDHHALGGCETFALGSALAGSEVLDLAHLPLLLKWQRDALASGARERDLAPSPMNVATTHESVHLRFLIGVALSSPQSMLLGAKHAAGWGIPLAQELAHQLASAHASVLALPRPPAAPLLALQEGQAAQRAVSAQLFVSNAARRMRAGVGEPSAVISAHRSPSAPGGGELRLSLSSPFDPRQAEGFRCPLFASDAVEDVLTMLVELLHDCRIGDVRVLPGIHPDTDAQTGVTLLFKADAIPGAERASVH